MNQTRPKGPGASSLATLSRMQAQQEALGAILNSEAFAQGDVEELAREITRLATLTLAVERASVWLFSPDERELRCIDLFEATPGRHSAGLVLTETQYAAEFAALRGVGYVAADEPLEDPRTRGYAEGYLKPARITSMLDALIRSSGQRLGVLCLEHVGRPHHWERDEILFASQLASKIALALLIRARGDAVETLAASEARYRSILDASPDGIAITDLTGHVTMASPMARKMLRSRDADQLVGRPITDFVVPEDREEAFRRLALAFGGVRSPTGEYRGLRLDGSTFDIEVNAEFIRGSDGKPSGFVFMVRDVTERREAQHALRQSNALLQSIIETVPARIFWKDLDLRYRGCNTQFARDAGLSFADELIGKTDHDLVWRDQASLYQGDDRAVMESGVPKIDYEEPQTTPGGATIWLSTSKVPLRDERHEVSGILGTYHDITVRKVADDALRESLTEKESLLKEIHHRVKNNLQVINSLLRLEAGRSKDKAVKTALGEMQGRVLSMSVLHETLYKTRTYGRVDLASYLKELSQQFFRAHAAPGGAVRLVLNLSPVEVGVDQGVPCGLMVNELMTNCFKYAFPGSRGGEIRVGLQSHGDHEILLSVEDTGPGLPEDFEARRSSSLGMQLVADLTRQIGGRLVVGPGPGARFEITFASGTGKRTRPKR